MAKSIRQASLRTLWPAALAFSLSLTPLANSEPTILDRLPEMGDVSGNLMTPVQERRLGQAFMRHIQASGQLMEDPLIEDYLQGLGNALAKQSSTPGDHFRFFMIDDPSINAFAGPAGHIGIHSGLLLTTQSESELAAVLAHEIAHVSQRHLARTWQAASEMSTPNAALLIAAVLLGAAAGGDAGMAALMGGQAAIIQQQIDFTRANEKEADRVGIGILANAGFETRAMPSFFTRMGRANRSSADLPEFLRTHPVTTSRIADALGRAASFSYRQHGDDLRYQLTRAALRERSYADPEDAVGHFSRLLEDKRFQNEAATRYGLTLALIRAKQKNQAHKQMEKLLAEYPDSLEFIIAAAQLDIADGKPSEASARLRKALQTRLLSYPLQLTLAQTLILEGEDSKARQVLLEMTQQHPADARIFELLAHVEGRMENKATAHEYMSVHYHLSGNTSAAIQQLEIALRNKALSFYDRNRLESRLSALRNELSLETLSP